MLLNPSAITASTTAWSAPLVTQVLILWKKAIISHVNSIALCSNSSSDRLPSLLQMVSLGQGHFPQAKALSCRKDDLDSAA